jgi:hypothetical protein
MATYGAQPRKNRRPLLIGVGSGLAGLCVLCSCVGFLASKDDKSGNQERPAVPAAVTSANTATSVAATRAAVTTPPAVVVTTTVAPPPVVVETTTAATDDEDVYYKNCTEARNAGAAPLHRGEPGYRAALDRDGDGTACER